MGSTIGFDGELWLGGVAGVGNVDIDKAREGKVREDVWVCWTDIVLDTGWLGYRHVHASSIRKCAK